MTTYLMILVLGAVATTALFAIRLKKEHIGSGVAFLALLLGAALGLVFAKLVYYLLMLDLNWEWYGLGGLLRTEINEFSFFGGCAGVLLAVFLVAKITRHEAALVLDAFAPAGALMAYFARIGEYFLTDVDIRGDIQAAFLQRFPFAVTNEYEEWNLAVFFLAALAALIVCAVFLLRKKESAVDGLRMERVIFYLCLPQIFFESLRSDSIMLGFVRAEQLLCAVTFSALLIYGCAKAREKGFWKTWWPVAADLACIGVMVGVEFALDGKLGEIPLALSYGTMGLALACVLLCECAVTGKRLRRAG